MHRSSRVCIIAVALLWLVTVPVSAPAFSNEPDGFRGIKWGTKIGQAQGMVLVEDKGNEKYYARPDDKMKIGDARVDKIVYGFYRDEFFTVTIGFSTLMHFMSLKETLTNLYSEWAQQKEKDKYYWAGTKVYVSIDYRPDRGDGEILYSYMPIWTRVKNETKGKTPGDL